jgi:hypothetical protein
MENRLVCSPAAEFDGRTCFSKKDLIGFIQRWNAEHPQAQILRYASLNKGALLDRLADKTDCKGVSRDICIAEKFPAVAARSVRSPQPREWKKDPKMWLSNIDIENVMNQYNDEETYKYHFLGVFPIDFADKTLFGSCLYPEICNLDVVPLFKKGIRYLGMITNLDRSDQPGSHWTSLFICMDRDAPNFGAYYYDSVSRTPPPAVKAFFERIRDQLMAMPCTGRKKCQPFRIDYNKQQHQFANTECGMFSMVYQIRWIEMLRASVGKTTFEDVVKVKLRDTDMYNLRNILFRTGADLPTRAELSAAKRVLAVQNKTTRPRRG